MSLSIECVSLRNESDLYDTMYHKRFNILFECIVSLLVDDICHVSI